MDDNEQTREAFGVAITAMLETFGAEGTKPQLMGYWYALRDLSIDEVEQAVYAAMRTQKRRPMPAELRELVEGGSNADRAIEAWADVLQAIPSGPYKWVDFDDGVINATIRHLGGWPTFVSRFTGAESEKWARLEFLKCYEALASRRLDGEACDALPGIAEATAIGGVIRPPVPVRIGCSIERQRLASPREIKQVRIEGQRPVARLQEVPR